MSSSGKILPIPVSTNELTHSLTQTGKINQSINQSARGEAPGETDQSFKESPIIPTFKRPFNPTKQRCGHGEAFIYIGLQMPKTPEWDALRKIIGDLAGREGCSLSHLYREALIKTYYPWENSKDSRLTEYTPQHIEPASGWPRPHTLADESKSIYYLQCRFCGINFESSVDMAVPACPKHAKPEATA